jgi:hypothetical protein
LAAQGHDRGDDGDDFLVGDVSPPRRRTLVGPAAQRIVGGDDSIDGSGGKRHDIRDWISASADTVVGGDDAIVGGTGTTPSTARAATDTLVAARATTCWTAAMAWTSVVFDNPAGVAADLSLG